MATRFASARALAQRLILRNGVASATLRSRTEVIADSAKPWRSGTSTISNDTAPMVFVPAGANDSYVEGGNVHQADIMVLVAADDLSVTPSLKDEVIRGSDIWTIVNITEVNPNDEQVVFILLGVR